MEIKTMVILQNSDRQNGGATSKMTRDIIRAATERGMTYRELESACKVALDMFEGYLKTALLNNITRGGKPVSEWMMMDLEDPELSVKRQFYEEGGYVRNE